MHAANVDLALKDEDHGGGGLAFAEDEGAGVAFALFAVAGEPFEFGVGEAGVAVVGAESGNGAEGRDDLRKGRGGGGGEGVLRDGRRGCGFGKVGGGRHSGYDAPLRGRPQFRSGGYCVKGENGNGGEGGMEGGIE